MSLHVNRRLLNTEKLIFKTESLDSDNQVRFLPFDLQCMHDGICQKMVLNFWVL